MMIPKRLQILFIMLEIVFGEYCLNNEGLDIFFCYIKIWCNGIGYIRIRLVKNKDGNVFVGRFLFEDAQ